MEDRVKREISRIDVRVNGCERICRLLERQLEQAPKGNRPSSARKILHVDNSSFEKDIQRLEVSFSVLICVGLLQRTG